MFENEFFYFFGGTIFFLIPTTPYCDCSWLNTWNPIFCIFLLAPPLHNWFLHVYFAPSWVTLVFLNRTVSWGKSEKQNKASFCPFHEPDSAPAALILMLFYAPVLNSNADNKLLFPWALCDSCERLRFTSCAHSHGEKGCWKGNSSDAGEHTSVSGQANWRKQDVFVRQNKWSKWSASVSLWEDTERSLREKDGGKVFSSASLVCGLWWALSLFAFESGDEEQHFEAKQLPSIRAEQRSNNNIYPEWQAININR